MKAKFFHQTKRRWIRKLALLLIVASAVAFFYFKKEALKTQSLHWVSGWVKQDADLDLRIGRVKGNWLGSLVIQNVEVRAPWIQGPDQMLFSARSIQLKYRFLDFLSKRFNSKVSVIVDRPEVRLIPAPSVRSKKRIPLISWFRDWAASQRAQFRVEINNMKLIYGLEKNVLSGIDITYDDEKLTASIPFSHIPFMDSDLSTNVLLDGHFVGGLFKGPWTFQGNIQTQGSVVNWGPLPWEISADYELDAQSIHVQSFNFLGGMEMDARLDLSQGEDLAVRVSARGYGLSNLEAFFKTESHLRNSTRMDLDVTLDGNLFSPNMKVRALVYDGLISKKAFKAMEVNASGVYPQLQLADSRILLEGGQAMRLADKPIEFHELFRSDTYKILFSEAKMDKLEVGGWEFSRPQYVSEEPDFLLKKGLGDRAKVLFRHRSETEQVYDPDPSEARQVEVGLEYKLKAKDSLKVELRENEEIIGVERKMRF